MARKLDPCELVASCSETKLCKLQRSPERGPRKSGCISEFCIHGQCDVQNWEERLTGWSTDGELQRA